MSYFTVIIRPIPRGISKDDLMADHLLKYGQIKDIRFGNGRGVSGDIMYVDYFEAESAKRAVEGMNGNRDPGLSRLKLSVVLAPVTEEAIRKLKVDSENACKRLRLENLSPGQSLTNNKKQPLRPGGAFKFLKSKATNREICVIDFHLLGL